MHFLLNLSPYLLLAISIFLFTFINVTITYFFRRYQQAKKLRYSSEKVGEFLGLLGGIYGLLLGFVVLLVYDSFNDAQAKANQEQSLARSLYQEIRYYPDTAKTVPLMKLYLDYVHSVIEDEYPAMEKMDTLADKNNKHLNKVYIEMEKLNSADPKTAFMIMHLSEMSMYRSLRVLGASSDIPLVIWLPLLIGYLILIVCSLFLHIESSRMHLFVTGMLGAFIGLVIFIIVSINHPFTGDLRIDPDIYKSILQMQAGKM